MSDGPSIQNHRITISYFRTCSTCRSRSQAPLCYYTQRLISDQPEGTFERLRYFLVVAALAASLLYDRASEIAEVKSDGPGSFQVALLDALWNVTADQVAASDIIETN